MGERTRELLVLLIGDTMLFGAALWFSLFLRYLKVPNAEILELHLTPFTAMFLGWIFIFYIAGLYDKHTIFLKSLLRARIIVAQVCNVAISGFLFLVLPLGITPKTTLIIYVVVSSLLILLWRLSLFNLFSSKKIHNALLIADGEEAEELIQEVNQNKRYNYRFIKMINEELINQTPDFEQKLLDVIEEEKISVIVVDSRSPHFENFLPKLFELTFLKFKFTFLDFHRIYEETFDKVALSSLHYEWFITNVSQSRRYVYDIIKRMGDIVGAIVVGFIFLGLLPIIYIAMRIEGNRRIFMTQKRMGQHNTRITVYKVQTMTSNDQGSSTWLPEDALKSNVVTKVGAVLRKMSIDEMPQVWNILKGEMSLIGPRNDIEGLGERLAREIPYYNIRNLVKPGVTGWAQTHQHYMGDNISPQSLEETRCRLAYDLYYVKNRSILLDLSIALRTIKTLLSRFGLTIKVR
ncbi:MAG: sugar transferase [Candidatus Pacebacteria bacterium]|nr:sugar transferase [Candidatus Paceibacterota bacterium]MCF7856902.1 sugar transferase [Candidatus Paceibacterota bacterium]